MPFAARAAQRYVLFQSLYDVSQSKDHNWDQVVALLSRGEQTAQRAKLDSLAQQFADGQQVVLDELREGGLFKEWELQFMRLGLAVGNLGRVYLRLAEHYRLQVECSRRLQRGLLASTAAGVSVALLLPLLLAGAGSPDVDTRLLAVVYGVAPLLVFALLLVPAIKRDGSRHWWRDTLYALPGVGAALRQYQNYHYINHLADCVAAGFSLKQALTQAARRMPDSPVKVRYFTVSKAVEGGKPLSAALMAEGVLEGVRFEAMPSGVSASEVPAQLGLAMHDNCESNLKFWTRAVPGALLLGYVAYLVLINAWFLWR